jgi:hypothetical protein
MLAVPFNESFGSYHQKVTVGGFLNAGSPQLGNDCYKFAVHKTVEAGECTHPEIAIPAEVKTLDPIAIAGTGMVKGRSASWFTGAGIRNSCQAATGAHPKGAIRRFHQRAYENWRILRQKLDKREVPPVKTEEPVRSADPEKPVSRLQCSLDVVR